jgi:glucose/arabinose dehydrogenase
VVATADLASVRVQLTPVAQLDEPIRLTHRAGDTSLYIAERSGRIRALRDGGLAEEPVLDISSTVSAGGERGLLDITFSPDGTRIYVDYTDRQGDTNVDEYAVAADGSIDTTSRRQVLFQDQPYPNHNGGNLVFGPDGDLYIGLGDGGSEGDPQRTGLDRGTWLGKILRIDPRPTGAMAYTVPPDNPFVGQAGVRPEIWSYGLRNPWRFSFDAANNDLWIGDVGQDTYEEVDRVTAADGAGEGVNFGWSAYEARSRYNDDQPADGVTMPVFQYTHGGGNCSVTGGFVYRGTAIAALRGAYVYADYCGRGVRAIAVDESGAAGNAVQLSANPASIVSFGEDAGGELYVCSLDGNTVYRIDPA